MLPTVKRGEESVAVAKGTTRDDLYRTNQYQYQHQYQYQWYNWT